MVREVCLLAALFLAYKLARLITAGEVAEAGRNAREVWDLERAMRLPSELELQQAMLVSTRLVESANTYYAVVHFPATVLFLAWSFWRRPHHYPWVRNSLVGLTAVSLAVHLLLPLAPPRMQRQLGFIDTGAVYGPSVYGPPATDSVANQYAAMPSLHVGWAVFVAIGLVVLTRSRWRWLWLLHPTITAVVVVGTGNHFWIDGIVAVVLLGLVLLVLGRPASAPQPRPHPAEPAGDPAERPAAVSLPRQRAGNDEPARP